MNLVLTELGKFVSAHGTHVSRLDWQSIICQAKRRLEDADRGQADVDSWKEYLMELARGCEELVKDDNFLRIIGTDEGEASG